MTHGEKMARAALEKWLRLWERQQNCVDCCTVNHQCERHPRSTDEFNRLVEQTRLLLTTGPN